MKLITLLILLGLLAFATTVFSQDTNAPAQEKGKSVITEVQGHGFNGPMFHGGRQGGVRGRVPIVSPNDREDEWDTTLAARRFEFRHKLNPNGPYPRGSMFVRGGPREPMWAQGRGQRSEGVCKCQCHEKQGKGKQRRNGRK